MLRSKGLIVPIVAITFLIVLPLKASGLIQLPQTGQTTCYGADGAVISCPDTGQDGDMRAGGAWPAPRFATNSDATVTDNLTGLIWAPDAGTPSGACTGGKKDWPGALSYVACLNNNNYLSRSDWRLPNINELESLINAEPANNAVWLKNPAQGFSNVQEEYYWSSTTLAGGSAQAWSVHMSEGHVVNRDKTENCWVWPVRGTTVAAGLWKTGQTTIYEVGDDGDLQSGTAWPIPRFSAGTGTQAGCVTDNLTGVTWVRDLGGMMTWQEALDHVKGLDLCGYTDWRLPNRRELRGLVHYGEQNMATWLNAPPQGFSNVMANNYWSSTTFAKEPEEACYVRMSQGGEGGMDKDSHFTFVWPVRGAVVPVPGSDVSVVMADDTNPVQPDQEVTYTMTIVNNGPDAATGVTLTDTLPPSATFVSSAATQGTCSQASGTVTCSLGDMNNKATVTVAIVVRAPHASQTMTNKATVSCTSIDPNNANNAATEVTTVTMPRFTLAVAKAGTGKGTVRTLDNLINCGNDCAEKYDEGAVTTLVAEADGSATFTGWSGGGCSGAGACVITMNSDRTVTATFKGKFSLSGRVVRRAGFFTEPIAKVTMALSGDATGTTVTDTGGNYTFTGLGNGTYVVAPGMAQYTFTPVSRTVTVNNANVSGQNFMGALARTTYSISGTVTSGGSPLKGVKVSLGGKATGTTTTDTNGNYFFTGLTNGTYSLTASMAGYSFAPVNRAVSVNGANATGLDFSGTATGSTYSLSGSVRTSGFFSRPLSGVTITLSGTTTGTTTTNSSGNYTLTGLANGTYAVTPSMVGYRFTPVSRTVTVSNSSVSGQNFTGSR